MLGLGPFFLMLCAKKNNKVKKMHFIGEEHECQDDTRFLIQKTVHEKG